MEIKKRVRRLALIGGWAMLGVCLPWGLWCYFHIPTPGKGGLLLASVATVMPLVWEDVREFGRAGLILTLVILFAVEYRAIDKEHKTYADEQTAARKEERESFQKLLDKQEESVNRILEQEDKNFAKTFGEFVKQNKAENARFYALLGKQEALFNRQEELAQSLSGRLVSGNEPMSHLCGWPVPAGAVVLLYGPNGSLIKDLSATVHPVLFSMKFGQVIGISRSADGSITVFLDIRDSDRKIIARLDQDGFVVNRNNFLEMRRDKSHLKIVDEYGDDVLDVDYMNPQTIRVNATIKFPERAPFRLGYEQGMTNICTDTNGRAPMDVVMP